MRLENTGNQPLCRPRWASWEDWGNTTTWTQRAGEQNEGLATLCLGREDSVASNGSGPRRPPKWAGVLIGPGGHRETRRGVSGNGRCWASETMRGRGRGRIAHRLLERGLGRPVQGARRGAKDGSVVLRRGACLSTTRTAGSMEV